MTPTILYVVILTFMIGPGNVNRHHWIKCEHWECVDNVLAHAHESPALARLRVFEGDVDRFLPISGVSIDRPLIDYWYQ
jgi:hypothetical protein